MDRFFSKLDLRDIKIDPFKASYPPDAEDVVEGESEYGGDAEVAQRPVGGARQPHTPAWATAESDVANGYDEEAQPGNTYNDVAPYGNGGYIARDAAPAVEHRNGDVLKVSARSRPSAQSAAHSSRRRSQAQNFSYLPHRQSLGGHRCLPLLESPWESLPASDRRQRPPLHPIHRVAAFDRNRRPLCLGMGDRFPSESLAAFRRIPQSGLS